MQTVEATHSIGCRHWCPETNLHREVEVPIQQEQDRCAAGPPRSPEQSNLMVERDEIVVVR